MDIIEHRPLPCLNSNISTEPTNRLSTQHRKTAFVLKETVLHLAQTYGIEKVGFLTLTFAQHITDPKEAQRRLNSLTTHVLKQRYAAHVGVFERQKSGRIHYHFLVALPWDIRSGLNFEDLANQNYRSANQQLRSEWAFWRKTSKAYGFGRTELLPIKSTDEAIAKYVGKYVAKHITERLEADKGVRLVRYSQNIKAGNTRFNFHSPGGTQWRKKLAAFASIVQSRYPDRDVSTITALSEILGPRWAYNHRDYILNMELKD